MATVKNEETKTNGIEEKILDAAMHVVSTKTISGTRMQLIADAAGIPKSNLHYYFKTKQNLMLALHRRAVTRLIDVRRETRPKCRDALRAHMELFFSQKLYCILNDPEFDFVEIDFWSQTNIEPEYRSIMRDAFRIWRQEIEDIIVRYKPDLPELERKQLPYVLISLLEGATLQYHLDSQSFDIKSYMDYCVDLICQQAGGE
jgi:AcrR family transcriptional regulator